VHLVSNLDARDRLLLMGEEAWRIHVIGSPELDTIRHADLPDLAAARARYGIPWDTWCLCVWHPDTVLAPADQRSQARAVVDAMLKSALNWIVILPSSDPGSEIIRDEYRRLANKRRFKVLPTMRQEYYFTALDHAGCIMGNSSSGIREAPALGTPTCNVGTREVGRSTNRYTVHVEATKDEILSGIARARARRPPVVEEFGDGGACVRFDALIRRESFWTTPLDKRAPAEDVAA